ncbi:hypothetical protein BYT27DRAFT_7079361 [Phlegmacium glaucopus]|nr:hypothetical protein BYT27DRAFT_7079361 [Phlegmacium glaucopus]
MDDPITPPCPYGLSRTTGGLFCGNTYGNALSHADFEDVNIDYLGPVEDKPAVLQAKVYLYVSPLNPADVDLAITKPMSTVTVKDEKSLGPVLEEISAKWSPIKRKLNPLIIIIIIIKIFIGDQVFVRVEDVWDVKGRYEQAVKQNESLDWMIESGQKIN